LKDQDVDGGLGSIDLGDIGRGSVDWIQLAQDRDQWRALVNTVVNLWVLASRN
jgi:hypothetical protein